MADIKVASENWRKLRGSANCYLPKLVDASAAEIGGFSNSDLHRGAQSKALKGFSAHVVGRALALEAITHTKAEEFLIAYSGMPADIQAIHGVLTSADIVGAFLVIPALTDLMASAGFDVPALAAASGISERAIVHGQKNGRVTGGIAGRLHHVLGSHGAALPQLGAFASSDHRLGAAKMAMTPFSLSDLLIAPPATHPDPWP